MTDWEQKLVWRQLISSGVLRTWSGVGGLEEHPAPPPSHGHQEWDSGGIFTWILHLSFPSERSLAVQDRAMCWVFFDHILCGPARSVFPVRVSLAVFGELCSAALPGGPQGPAAAQP